MKYRTLLFVVFIASQLFAQQHPFVLVLGTAQDGGYPQAACKKECCTRAWKEAIQKRLVSCLALVDPKKNKAWIFDATPDFKEQLQLLRNLTNDSIQLAGIFLTHAHIGHYTGLMNLGREVMGANKIPVYAMPRMKSFIENNGPWSLLIQLNNIKLIPLENNKEENLDGELTVGPILVPHRDEFSETVGYKISYQKSIMLFIPDIDKWERWDHSIREEVKQVKYAFVDATFFDENELGPGRMKDIPHPFVSETMKLFEGESNTEKQKIHFIHLNHTNSLLNPTSKEFIGVKQKGFNMAEQGKKYFFVDVK